MAKAFISGGFGGICLVVVGHPLDTIKVRLQTSDRYKGMVDCFQQTVRKDGPMGLYKGMGAPLLSVSPIFAVYFWGFDVGKDIARAVEGKTGTDEPLSTGGICFAGGFSAIPGSAVMVPGDRIKVVLQSQITPEGEKPKYAGPLDAFKKILAEDGVVKGLYKGTGLTLLRDVPGSVAYYAAYELLRDKLADMWGRKPDGGLSPVPIMTAGGLAGMSNWIVAVPADVAKSRYQTAPSGTYTGIAHVFKDLVAKEGLGGLYKGVGPALLRAFPSNAACFMGVEFARKTYELYLE